MPTYSSILTLDWPSRIFSKAGAPLCGGQLRRALKAVVACTFYRSLDCCMAQHMWASKAAHDVAVQSSQNLSSPWSSGSRALCRLLRMQRRPARAAPPRQPTTALWRAAAAVAAGAGPRRRAAKWSSRRAAPMNVPGSTAAARLQKGGSPLVRSGAVRQCLGHLPSLGPCASPCRVRLALPGP